MARAAVSVRLLRVNGDRPATCAALVVTLLSLAPVLVGRRFLGLDHSRVLLSMMCGGRGEDGVILDASFGGGGPLLEEPQGLVLYPTSWLSRALGVDVELAASLFVIIHLALAAAAATQLARAKGISRIHAFAFGVAFATCGSVLDLILHGPYLVGAAGLALAWAGASAHRRPVSQLQLSATVMLALGPALLLLSGELQSLGVALAIVLLELALQARRIAIFAHGMLAFASGTLIGGAQLLLSLALASATSRAARVTDPYVWSLEPLQLIGVVWPGDLIEQAANGASLLTAGTGDALARPPWNLSPFLGVPVLALACVAVAVVAHRLVAPRAQKGPHSPGRARVRARTRMVVPSLVAVFATLFALGNATPVLGVALTLVPPLGYFRYPAKYFVVASLALLLLAFHVVALASRASRTARARRFVQGALVASLLACAVGVVVAIAQREHVDALAAAVAARPPWPGVPSLGALLVSRAAFAFALAALATLVAFKDARQGAALPLVLALGLVVPFARGLPTGEPLTALPARGADASLTVAAARAQSPGAPPPLLCHGRGIGARHVDRADEPLGIEGDMIVDWLDHKPNMHQCQDIAVPHAAMASSQAPTYTLATTLDETAAVPAHAWALGCTHVATRAAPDSLAALDTDAAIAPAAGVDAPVYPLRAHARTLDVAVARAPRFFASSAEVLAALSTTLAAPHDVANLIDDPLHRLKDRAGTTSLPVASPSLQANATWLSTTQATVTLSGAQGGAVIALRRPWWPGFTATQAGAPVTVVRASGVQLAIVVDDVTRGDVLIEYRVRNARAAGASFAAGCLLFAVVARARARANNDREGR